jgi:hypothetical protein
MATCSVAYLGAGRAPGYRIIVVLALMFFVTGLARWWAGGRPVWAALVGASGVLAFTGKPTSAAALGLLLIVALLVARVRPRLPEVGWAAAGALAAACLVLVAAGMTPSELVGYIASGLDTEKSSGSHSSLATMLGFSSIPLGALLVLGPIIYLPLVPAVHDAARNSAPRWPWTAQLVAGLAAPLVACLLGVWLLSQKGFAVQIGELVIPWPVGAALLLALVFRRTPKGGVRRAPALVVVLLALPYVAAVGTNTNFTISMIQAAVFWALAVVAALSMAADRWSRTGRLLLPAALLLVTTTLVTQVVWTADSLEGHEVHSAARVTKLLGGHLMVSPETADLLDQLTALSDTYGLADRPSVDLTGYGAGYQLVLGTRPLGRASFFGTFDGAERGAAAALARESCDDLRSAVVLYADHNPLSVASAASTVGLDLGSGYRTIFTFHPTHGTAPIREQTIRVLLPDPAPANAGSCPDRSARSGAGSGYPSGGATGMSLAP